MKRAVLYLCARPTGLAGRTLEEEKERGIRYCAMQGYKVLVILKFIGEDTFMENSAWGRLQELVRNGFVDVVILIETDTLFEFLTHASRILAEIYRYGVMIDCVGCGVLRGDVFSEYLGKNEREKKDFQRKLEGLMLEWKK